MNVEKLQDKAEFELNLILIHFSEQKREGNWEIKLQNINCR